MLLMSRKGYIIMFLSIVILVGSRLVRGSGLSFCTFCLKASIIALLIEDGGYLHPAYYPCVLIDRIANPCSLTTRRIETF